MTRENGKCWLCWDRQSEGGEKEREKGGRERERRGKREREKGERERGRRGEIEREKRGKR